MIYTLWFPIGYAFTLLSPIYYSIIGNKLKECTPTKFVGSKAFVYYIARCLHFIDKKVHGIHSVPCIIGVISLAKMCASVPRLNLGFKLLLTLHMQMQEFIIRHSQQYIIELDANLPPVDILQVQLLIPVHAYK